MRSRSPDRAGVVITPSKRMDTACRLEMDIRSFAVTVRSPRRAPPYYGGVSAFRILPDKDLRLADLAEEAFPQRAAHSPRTPESPRISKENACLPGFPAFPQKAKRLYGGRGLCRDRPLAFSLAVYSS
jgi:hypothetical protein